MADIPDMRANAYDAYDDDSESESHQGESAEGAEIMRLRFKSTRNPKVVMEYARQTLDFEGAVQKLQQIMADATTVSAKIDCLFVLAYCEYAGFDPDLSGAHRDICHAMDLRASDYYGHDEELWPPTRLLRLCRSRISIRSNQVDDALIDLKAILDDERCPVSFRIYALAHVGWIQSSKQEYASAVHTFDELLRLDPDLTFEDSKRSLALRGAAKHRLGDADAGLEDVNAALSKSPDCLFARFARFDIRAEGSAYVGAFDDVCALQRPDAYNAGAALRMGVFLSILLKDKRSCHLSHADQIKILNNALWALEDAILVSDQTPLNRMYPDHATIASKARDEKLALVPCLLWKCDLLCSISNGHVGDGAAYTKAVEAMEFVEKALQIDSTNDRAIALKATIQSNLNLNYCASESSRVG